MPWSPSDAKHHTKKANTPARKKHWSKIANAVLRRTGNDAMAIRVANSKMEASTLPRTLCVLSETCAPLLQHRFRHLLREYDDRNFVPHEVPFLPRGYKYDPDLIRLYQHNVVDDPYHPLLAEPEPKKLPPGQSRELERRMNTYEGKVRKLRKKGVAAQQAGFHGPIRQPGYDPSLERPPTPETRTLQPRLPFLKRSEEPKGTVADPATSAKKVRGFRAIEARKAEAARQKVARETKLRYTGALNYFGDLANRLSPEAKREARFGESLLRRTPLLVEAIKGGIGSDDLELHGFIPSHNISLTHDPKTGQKIQSISEGLRQHKDLISNPRENARVQISVMRRGTPLTQTGETYSFGEHRPIAFISSEHPRESVRGRPVIHPESGLPTVKTEFVTTHPEHLRKGWASTIFDHAHRLLKQHAGVHLEHDWGHQLDAGKRWAARQETARGAAGTLAMPVHRQHQAAPLRSLALVQWLGTTLPHLSSDQHSTLSNVTNKILDSSGGFYGRREVNTLKRVGDRLGLLKRQRGKPNTWISREILSRHGGVEE